MARQIHNDIVRYIVLIIWMGINIFLFAKTYYDLTTTKENMYLNKLVKFGLALARAPAAVLNFNCMLILLTMCRNLLSFIRGTFKCSTSVLRLLDKNISFHKYIAYMICLQTVIHCVAHIFNVEFLIMAWSKGGIYSKLCQLDDSGNETYINPIRDPKANPIAVLWTLAAGVTGAVITLALILMISSSTELIRRSYFEVFWYNHHYFVIFYIGLVIHGIQGVIRYQSNVDEHDPEVCMDPKLWFKHKKCMKPPKFVPFGMNTWKWIVGPMFLIVVERLIRLYRSKQPIQIIKVVKHPSNVIQIKMKKKGFKQEAGQYIFLQCPAISRLEWHPFTLTSAPEEECFSVHIRLVGDWTRSLAKLCGCDGYELLNVDDMPKLAVDGPFGTSSEDVFHPKYSVCVLVGAGIGVTPFASILKSIWYRHSKADTELNVKKVYFFWICPDTNAFEWFTDLLKSLEDQMNECNNKDFIEYNIFLTRGWGPNMARDLYLREDQDVDPITQLQQKTRYGRPEWNGIFEKIARHHPRTNIGVFFCGPAVLSHTLHKMADTHSDISTGAKFFYNKENF
ncbi:cytochrome b-245 heavy chain [Exaiptasia diaphana]|uniref:FAD-binding FR-type domain-containing protein n=1 Tax=Exaiptasia diaphana TaxID=2652724 RepID=A0A913WYL7_EXADI|nr:cytochrome b-245 heavy chain [Exaiptasia diaphana]KXJ16767.1 Cytochrome b-245 heavy chain [Exaiptasia diaphana]